MGKRAVAGHSKIRRQLEQEQDVRARARAMKTRAMLCGEAALRTLDIGRYGVCQHCDEPIPRRRLLALPTAILCRQCQEAAEEVRAACRACAPDRQPAVSATARRPVPSGAGSRKEHGRLTTP